MGRCDDRLGRRLGTAPDAERPPAAMAASGPSVALLLLLGCALLAGASPYVRRQDVFAAGPLSESAAPSLISCAARCNSTTGCVGFTRTDAGLCQLFDGPLSSSGDPYAGAIRSGRVAQLVER